MNKTYYALAIEAFAGNMAVISQFLEKLNITPLKAQKLSDVNDFLNKGLSICVALIDIMGFDSQIWYYCKLLREKNIPMLIISPNNSQQILKASYELGAMHVFKKPIVMNELSSFIKLFLQEEENLKKANL